MPVLDSGARGSTTTFVEREIGDVLIAWENEARMAIKQFGADKFEVVYPSISILAEPPVAWVDKVDQRHGTQAISKAYLEFLYTPAGQEIIAQNFFRPRDKTVAAKYASQFPQLAPADDRFGFWRMEKGAAEVFRRRRRIRQDLSAGKLAEPGHYGMAVKAKTKRTNVLPGFGLTLGFTLAYLGIVVLIPISTIFFKTFTLTWPQFWAAVASPRTIAAYRLSFGASIAGALINSVFGFIVAWSLVRYEFPGKTLIDVMVDLPFALPTSVAGITLTAIYAGNGWIGRYLAPLGIKVAYAPLGVVVALTFVGLPFVVRTIQPVLEDLDQEYEEAAATLGASRLQTFVLVIAPALIPALLTGFALAFARALGEYGSVVFISGNMPMHTEVVPLLIMSKLEQFDYAGATAIAVVMLTASFVLLLGINVLQRWSSRRLAA